MKPVTYRKQRGVTLIVGLIFLVLMTLFALAVFNLGKSNLVIVGNMQSHGEALSAANSAIEEVLSKADFSVTPAAAFGTSNSKSYTINGHTDAITVTLAPQPCIKTYKNVTVDSNDTSTQGCAESTQQQFGVHDAATGGSGCADVVWEITAVATDNVTKATSSITEGVRLRQDAAAAANTANFCP